MASRRFTDSEIRAYTRNRYEDKVLRTRLQKLREELGDLHDSSAKHRSDLIEECRQMRKTSGGTTIGPSSDTPIELVDFSTRVSRPWAYSVMETTYNAAYQEAIIPIPKRLRAGQAARKSARFSSERSTSKQTYRRVYSSKVPKTARSLPSRLFLKKEHTSPAFLSDTHLVHSGNKEATKLYTSLNSDPPSVSYLCNTLKAKTASVLLPPFKGATRPLSFIFNTKEQMSNELESSEIKINSPSQKEEPDNYLEKRENRVSDETRGRGENSPGSEASKHSRDLAEEPGSEASRQPRDLAEEPGSEASRQPRDLAEEPGSETSRQPRDLAEEPDSETSRQPRDLAEEPGSETSRQPRDLAEETGSETSRQPRDLAEETGSETSRQPRDLAEETDSEASRQSRDLAEDGIDTEKGIHSIGKDDKRYYNTKYISLPAVYKIDSVEYQNSKRQQMIRRARSRNEFTQKLIAPVMDSPAQSTKSPSNSHHAPEPSHVDAAADNEKPKAADAAECTGELQIDTTERNDSAKHRELKVFKSLDESVSGPNCVRSSDLVTYRGKTIHNYIRPEERYKLDPLILKRRQNRMDKLTKESATFLKRVNHENIKVEIAFPRSTRTRLLTQLVDKNNSKKGNKVTNLDVVFIQNKVENFMVSISDYIGNQHVSVNKHA